MPRLFSIGSNLHSKLYRSLACSTLKPNLDASMFKLTFSILSEMRDLTSSSKISRILPPTIFLSVAVIFFNAVPEAN